MPAATEYPIQLARHTLRIADPDISLAFYQQILGMTLLAERSKAGETHYFLGFVEPGCEPAPGCALGEAELRALQRDCLLELVHDPRRAAADVRIQPDKGEGYWKISLSVADLDVARDRLLEEGVDVDTPRQVGDIAYLCHFNDPDNYCIELIQHDFQQNHQAESYDPNYKLGTRPGFLLITYRVKDAAASLAFYTELLGMRLLSKQTVEARGFTLYFLAHASDELPEADVEHVANREWLWQRPFAMVEFQHVWGTEVDADFAYRVDPESGFEGISVVAQDLNELRRKLESRGHKIEVCDDDLLFKTSAATVIDPDGYLIRLIDSGAAE